MRLFVVLLLTAIMSGPAAHGAADPSRPAERDGSLRFSALSTLEFPVLKTTLEQAGWPADHVQAFLNAEIQRRLNPPDELTASDFPPFEFWRTGPDAEPCMRLKSPEYQAARERKAEVARAQFDALFPPTEPGENALLNAWNERRQWGSLSPAKRQAVAEVLRRGEKAIDDFRQVRGGMLTQEEQLQLQALAKRTRAEMTALLTPEELLDYDLRNSSTANRLRTTLDNFQPTREEFLAIFRAQHPLELDFGFTIRGRDRELDRQYAAAETTAEHDIAAALGKARYADYRLSLEPDCQRLQFDGRYLHAKAADIRALYRAMLSVRSNLAELTGLSDAERAKKAATLRSELFAQFRRVLDEEGARRYLQEQNLWP